MEIMQCIINRILSVSRVSISRSLYAFVLWFLLKAIGYKVPARKGYEMLDGVAKSNFNFEYFIVSIYVICELLLYWKLKKNHFGKKKDFL